MGTKYSTEAISGYNSSPPADDGTTAESNKLKWSNHKDKLGDPLKTAIENIDTKLVTFADLGPVSKAIDFTTTAAEHEQTIEVTGTTTITLGVASSMGAGYIVTIKNAGSNTVTVARSGADTIDGGTSDTLLANESATYKVNTAADGYLIESRYIPRSGADATVITGTAGTDQNLIEWDANGDAIDSGIAAGDVVTPSSTDTFTNKTFDANATGNSLSNVDVADLAVGTDGELITWDAAGNPATVSVGTAGQVLTSNGAGAAPTFNAISLTTDSVDAITEIAASIKSGSDATLVTGTAGTDQNLIEWDANGDAIDSGLASADVSNALTRVVQVVAVEYSTDTSTGDGKAYFHIPASLNGMNLTTVHAEVITAGTTGTTDIQIHNVTDAVDMLSTKITIDSGETGSDTAVTPAVINTANDDVATNDLIRIDVDAVSTTAAKGLIVTMEFA